MFLKKLFHRHNWQVVDRACKVHEAAIITLVKYFQCKGCGKRKLLLNPKYIEAAKPFTMQAYNWVNKGDKNV